MPEKNGHRLSESFPWSAGLSDSQLFPQRPRVCSMCAVASSGLAHDGSTKEADWKWNTFLAIKEGFLVFGTFAASYCLCADVFRSGAEWDSLCCFWMSQCIVHTLLRNLLGPHINTTLRVASVSCVGADPCHLHGTRRGTTQKPWRFFHILSETFKTSGQHCGLRQRSFLSLHCVCLSFWKTRAGDDDD